MYVSSGRLDIMLSGDGFLEACVDVQYSSVMRSAYQEPSVLLHMF